MESANVRVCTSRQPDPVFIHETGEAQNRAAHMQAACDLRRRRVQLISLTFDVQIAQFERWHSCHPSPGPGSPTPVTSPSTQHLTLCASARTAEHTSASLWVQSLIRQSCCAHPQFKDAVQYLDACSVWFTRRPNPPPFTPHTRHCFRCECRRARATSLQFNSLMLMSTECSWLSPVIQRSQIEWVCVMGRDGV
jgi:hypothetical protein